MKNTLTDAEFNGTIELMYQNLLGMIVRCDFYYEEKESIEKKKIILAKLEKICQRLKNKG